MVELLTGWKGSIDINGTVYNTIAEIPENLELKEGWCIKLLPKNYNKQISGNTEAQSTDKQEYFITVKKYMTQKATPEFDFMSKFNNDNPMPMRMMAGTIEKETRGMYYMKLHGTMYAEKMCTCMMCGRTLTNPVSQYVGMGPECGKAIHMNLSPEDIKDIKTTTEQVKKELVNVVWEGWCIKSAITSMEEINEGSMETY